MSSESKTHHAPLTTHHSEREPSVLVLDFGAQYAQLIARRVREAHVRLRDRLPRHHRRRDQSPTTGRSHPLRRSGLGLRRGRLSHGPRRSSILGSPILGICYGHQLLADMAGGKVVNTGSAEYGNTDLEVTGGSVLFRDLPAGQQVWMSHQDQVHRGAEGFVAAATSAGARGGGDGGSRAWSLTGSSSIPRSPTRREARRSSSGSSTTSAAHRRPGHLTRSSSHQVEAIRPRSERQGGLRPLRRRRLGGGRGPGPRGGRAISSPASSSTTACCGPVRPSRSTRPSALISRST